VVLEEQRICDVLHALREGVPPDADAFDHLLLSLRRLARKYMSQQHGPHLLQTTALMHEAYVRLFDRTDPQWNDAAHFFHSASAVMHRILVDHARRMAMRQRGAAAAATPGQVDPKRDDPCFDIIAIDDCLAQLTARDPQMAQIVQLHVFGGRTLPEVAAIMRISQRTIEREWQLARSLLRVQLRHG
jgi:RNA polymerase sigma factor (TIGR02999 family)